MIKDNQHISEFGMALRNFKRNRFAVICVVTLCLLYASAIFADFLSPYSYKNEDRNYSYCPPIPIKIFDSGKLAWPFINEIKLTFDEYNKRVYIVDTEKKYPLRLFTKGDEYKLLGFIPARHHLFGIHEEGRIYLLGADARGRDILSRLLYGGRVSLSIGLIGVLISFSIGLIVGGIAGYWGGKIDNVLMRICEMFMMVPGFYLLLALRAAVPDNFSSVQVYFSIILILSFIGWAGLARIIRGMCLSLREREYVLAAKSLGLTDFQIMICHNCHIIGHVLNHTQIMSDQQDRQLKLIPQFLEQFNNMRLQRNI